MKRRVHARLFQALPTLAVKLLFTTLFGVVAIVGFFPAKTMAADLFSQDGDPLDMPTVGTTELRILTSNSLELSLINTKASPTTRVPQWDFVSDNFVLTAPSPSEFAVSVNGTTVGVSKVGFKRRVLFAPVSVRDLRLFDCLYLELATAVPEGATVEVKNPNGRLWSTSIEFKNIASPTRLNPAIHVNQAGYMPTYPKKATVGYYLGSLGELTIPSQGGFKLLDAKNGAVVYFGALTLRADIGFKYTPKPYQKVYQADFTAFQTPGEYRLQVPGMGVSLPFVINDGVTANFARTFALGMYHQRCGTEIGQPFTRHEHGICHHLPASIPTMDPTYSKVQEFLATVTSDYAQEPRHTAPRLDTVAASLYPFVNLNPVNVTRGHHDAGDYSKYTINSAGLVHHLIFAADSFAGAGALDNLGLPESGDGKSDLLQEAKWEADFLAQMQDADGGFYFLVYPKDRRYENDVLPDEGDPQVVWPKNTAATAAAVAALAEAGSSPLFKEQFPAEAAIYLQKAQLGWSFLLAAIARHGKDGSYQKITHYGHEFLHDDELAWAASALYAATGNSIYHAKLMEWLPDPNSISTRRWNWWRLFEGYGAAVRTYSFAARSGRLPANQLNASYLAKCNAEIIAAAEDHVRFSQDSSYGTSFPDLSKERLSAGWYFSSERAFDITVAYQLTPRADFLEAVIANINYEGGNNPVNMTYITGIGLKRQRDVVHQHAQNDRQVLPPTGLPQGNVVDGMGYHYHYGSELGRLAFPSDFSSAPYPMYDRWSDSYNTKNEFVVVDQARSLGSLAFWMAQGTKKTQPWKPVQAQIIGLPAEIIADQPATVSLNAPGIDLSGATITWEVRFLEPKITSAFTFAPKFTGEHWIEAEALLPDGRRVFAASNFMATTSSNTLPNIYQSAALTPTADMAALYHADASGVDATAKSPTLTLAGKARFDTNNLGWMSNRTGGALRFLDLGDKATVQIPKALIHNGSGTTAIRLEAMIYVNDFKAYNRSPAQILMLQSAYEARIGLREDTYEGIRIEGGTSFSLKGPTLANALTRKTWHHLSIEVNKNGYTCRINGDIIASVASSEFANWANGNPSTLEIGNFDGWVDEVVVRSVRTTNTSAPVVALTSPLANSRFSAPASITMSANAVSSAGIAKVAFYVNGAKAGEDYSAPYAFSWNNVAAGSYTLTARATDLNGLVGASAGIVATVQNLNTVAAPLITPNGGNYTTPTPVTITSPTFGATIRYTVDGSAPASTSPVYTAPFTLTTSATVQARAFKSGMAESSVTSAVFSVDTALGNIASFIGEDVTTQGDWRGVYGQQGYNLSGYAANYPDYVQVSATGATQYTWTQSTTDPRALLKTSGADRMCITWYSPATMEFNVDINDGHSHKVSFYFLDWDRGGRSELVEVLDADTGEVLNSRTVSNFEEGKYLSWAVKGHVVFRMTRKLGSNALAMAIFFDAAPAQDKAALRPVGPAPGGGFKVKVTGTVGKQYRVEWTENHKTWTEAGSFTMTEPSMDFIDHTAPNSAHRFYRAILL